MKIVFLDTKTIGADIDLSGYERFGAVFKYSFTLPGQLPERIADADVVILNKVPVNAQTFAAAKKLKLVCVTATGTDNLDFEYLKSKNIAWRNVAAYSTESVAQHTFSMLFYLLEKMRYYDDYVKSGRYMEDTQFTHFDMVFHELHEMTWGIVGMGNIGQRVAQLARLFGCRILYFSTSGKNDQTDYQRVDFDTLLSQSDILSIHAPLNDKTRGLMDKCAFQKMKQQSIFLNLGRGAIVVEEDLAMALEQGEIGAAGLDVLTEEPMSRDNPLGKITDSSRLVITPHIAWASIEARTRLMKIIEGQIAEFFASACNDNES